VQPTDPRVRSVFVRLWHEGREEDRAWNSFPSPSPGRDGHAGDRLMKDRLLRLLLALSAVASVALAGGASLKGF